MAVRPIDGEELLGITRLLDTDVVRQSKTASWLLDQVLHDIQAMPTLTPPNEWASVEERLPETENAVLALLERGDCVVVWWTGNVWRVRWDGRRLADRELTHWMPLPAPPDKDNNVLAKTPNEPLTLERLREMDGEPVWIVDVGPHKWYGPGWAIVDRDNCLVRTAKNWNPVFFERYGERWIAYRRPPKGEKNDD